MELIIFREYWCVQRILMCLIKLKFSNTDPCEREPGSAGCLFLKQIWDKLKYIFIWSKYVVVISSLLTVLGLMWV